MGSGQQAYYDDQLEKIHLELCNSAKRAGLPLAKYKSLLDFYERFDKMRDNLPYRIVTEVEFLMKVMLEETE